MTILRPPRHVTRFAATLLAVILTAGLLIVVSGFLSNIDPSPSGPETNASSRELLGQGLIPNGGFENDFFAWTVVDSAAISTGTVHSGSNAFQATDSDSSAYAYVYQELGFVYDTTEITFWAYPASSTYWQVFEVIANWQNGTATFITRVGLTDGSIGFTAVDTSSSVANVLIPNAWNKITIKANRSTLTQDFYINDSLYSSLTSSEFPAVEHLLVGDLSITKNYGTLYYDDISITGSVTTPVPVAVDDEFVYDGDEPKFFPVLHNDVVPPGVTVEIVIDDPPEHGQILSIEEDGFWIQKEAGYEGTDEISYSLAALTPGSTRKTWLIDGAAIIYQIYICACIIFTPGGNIDECVGVDLLNPRDPLRKRFSPNHASLVDSLDIDLLIRWREEVLRATDAGSELFDNLVFNSPEIHQLVLIDQPALLDRILGIFLMFEDPARSLLDGDGSELVTQAEMDSLEALFASLRAGVSDEVSRDLELDLAAFGPLDDYVGLTVKDAFEMLQNATGTSVEEKVPAASTGFVLGQNFPNPFGATTQIRYTVDHPTSLSLAVYDIRGRKVRTLAEGRTQSGTQTVSWDGRDASGVDVSSGIYFVRLVTDTFQKARTMVVVRGADHR